jgi:ABC-type glycerol-3-phosphate transport system substrate-binding protein
VKRLLKNIGFALLLAPAAAILFFGPRQHAGVPKGRVVVTYWEKWTGPEERQMKIIVNEFNATVGRKKNIFVQFVSMADIDKKTLIATAAGDPPDIAGLWDNDIAQFASLGALTPLGQLARQHGITNRTYKKVYWRACHYHGRLYALVSTPADIALLYNKELFKADAAKLRAAGLNPNQAPQTIRQLDAYAHVLTKFGPRGQLLRAGFLPTEPGWYFPEVFFWFGGHIWNAKTGKFTLTSPQDVAAFRWIASYSKWLGPNAINSFSSAQGNFESAQNPFMLGTLAMEQQGPWMANYIYSYDKKFSTLRWPKAKELTMPLAQRRKNYGWAFAPFPSAVPGLKDVSYCGFDAFVIPRGARHIKQAFTFIAYVQRQSVMERLCGMMSKNSPLRKVSKDFLEHNPNPYINVFETLASSPNARGLPQIPILPQVIDELNTEAEAVALLERTPTRALQKAQNRLQREYDAYERVQRVRRRELK